MFSFKRSLIMIIGIVVISVAVATLMPFVISGQDKPLKRDARRSFYLTQTGHTGSEALTACAEGYHMASLYEILDPSNLRYDTTLGITTDDSGFGPPTSAFIGWIRTGLHASDSSTPGEGNCNAWTSASDTDFGTLVQLAFIQNSSATAVSPWLVTNRGCQSAQLVWCVQD